MPYLHEKLGLDVRLEAIENRFWGSSVTVSGLLTGQDMLRRARTLRNEFDVLVLPPNCLNEDELFLDNLSLKQFRIVLGKDVLVGQYDMAATIKDLAA